MYQWRSLLKVESYNDQVKIITLDLQSLWSVTSAFDVVERCMFVKHSWVCISLRIPLLLLGMVTAIDYSYLRHLIPLYYNTLPPISDSETAIETCHLANSNLFMMRFGWSINVTLN